MPEKGGNNRDKSNQATLFPSTVNDAMRGVGVVSVSSEIKGFEKEVRKIKKEIQKWEGKVSQYISANGKDLPPDKQAILDTCRDHVFRLQLEIEELTSKANELKNGK